MGKEGKGEKRQGEVEAPGTFSAQGATMPIRATMHGPAWGTLLALPRQVWQAFLR